MPTNPTGTKPAKRPETPTNAPTAPRVYLDRGEDGAPDRRADLVPPGGMFHRR
ncbi:hypothetical protein [Saccharopolyspora sp. 5N708]|uniref:hypothetical protein n=1 Tax=Saccharopolyspora sp. 5N708 TaxID=3457424 RepID=UPI003FCF1255